jgi:HK97 gp10 family phage protein
MAKHERFKVEGLAELAKALRELPDRVAKNGLRVSVYAGAKVIRDEARTRAPKAAEILGPNQPPPGTLKRSVIMKQIPELSSLTRQTFFVTVRHGKKYRKQGRQGNLSQDAWYWRFVEFGTRKMRARPGSPAGTCMAATGKRSPPTRCGTPCDIAQQSSHLHDHHHPSRRAG